jgi:N-acetylglucosaminyl-diphospho-decaprenol L-rhamnosyltransferase
MNSFPSLTLVTTVHNNQPLAVEMLASFEKYHGEAGEIVVVDDGSVPPVVVPALHSPLKLIRNETGSGYGKAVGQGMDAVGTPYALLVDADVRFLPGDFSTMFRHFQESAGEAAWITSQVDFDGNPSGVGEDFFPPAWIFGLGNWARGIWQKSRKSGKIKDGVRRMELVYSSCLLIRMEAYRQVGGFDPAFWSCEVDTDLCVRWGKARWKLGGYTGYTVAHRGEGSWDGSARRLIDMHRGRLRLYEKNEPFSRWYLRGLLTLRHAVETAVLAAGVVVGKTDAERLRRRWRMLTNAWRGYEKKRGILA